MREKSFWLFIRLGVTVVEATEIVQVVTAKSGGARGASCQPAL